MARRILAFAFLVACGGNVDLGGSPDGAALDAGPTDEAGDARACGALSPPNAPATCNACEHSNPTCQPNGCFNGYYCDAAKHDCHPPPSECD